jgi:hypothetical protein
MHVRLQRKSTFFPEDPPVVPATDTVGAANSPDPPISTQELSKRRTKQSDGTRKMRPRQIRSVPSSPEQSKPALGRVATDPRPRLPCHPVGVCPAYNAVRRRSIKRNVHLTNLERVPFLDSISRQLAPVTSQPPSSPTLARVRAASASGEISKRGGRRAADTTSRPRESRWLPCRLPRDIMGRLLPAAPDVFDSHRQPLERRETP